MSLLTKWLTATPLVLSIWLINHLAHALPGTQPFGCHAEFCWTTCFTPTGSGGGWCFTTATASRQDVTKLIYCKGNEKVCRAEWACEGPCKTDTGPENAWDIIKMPDATLGTWGGWDLCPEGSLVNKMVLKVEKQQPNNGDDSGLNGIQFYCVDPSNRQTESVTSSVGIFGDWGTAAACPGGHYAKSFEIRYSNGDDKYGATDFRVTCDDGTLLQSNNGLDQGDWKEPVKCPKDTFLCGIRTQVQPDQGENKDDTALNSVAGRCCPKTSLTVTSTDTTTEIAVTTIDMTVNMTTTTSDGPVTSVKVIRRRKRRRKSGALLLALPNVWLVISIKLFSLAIN